MLGAIIGDIVGSGYEFNNIKSKDFVLFSRDSMITDDTIMSLAVAEWALDSDHSNEKAVEILRKWGRRYKYAGYGGRFLMWLHSENPKPYNSFGNGSAMRISPIAYIAKDEKELTDMCHKVTEITHNHPEGMKGAEVTSMCIWMALHKKSKEEIRKYVETKYNINFDYNELVRNYSFNETCQNSVPQAIYCFLISNSFEDCLRTTISIGGDSDTLGAISCAIAEAYYGIPKDIENIAKLYISDEMMNLVERVRKYEK